MALTYEMKENDHLITPPWIIDTVARIAPIWLDPFAGDVADHAIYNLRLDHRRTDGGDAFVAGWRALYENAARTARRRDPKARHGLVFCNPPYSARALAPCMGRIIEQATEEHLQTVALVPASTGSQWYRGIWDTAQAVCQVYGRVPFVLPETLKPTETGGRFWSSIAYWGRNVARFQRVMESMGHVEKLRRKR